MLRQNAYCTVYYEQNSFTISLPDTTHVDCHVYLKEQLAQQGVKELCNKDIQVEADSSFGLLPSDAKLRRGSYRVTLLTDAKELSGSVAAVKWTPVFHMRHMSLLGYFPQDYQTPEALHLQLAAHKDGFLECVERRSQYEIDSRLLEAPFYEHFRQKTPSVEFVIDPDLEQSVQESQQALLQDLHKRHLMLRVLFLAAGQELLLMTSKADAGMYGYLEKTGIIESLVMQEYKSFIGRSPPQMVLVLDLDRTIVHTPKPSEQCYLGTYQQSGRVVDIAIHNESSQRVLCAPRSQIRDFFCLIKDVYHVLYCTAGQQSYGVAVLKCLRNFMLRGGDLDVDMQKWIRGCTDERRVVSNAFSRNKNFKSLGMLLKMAYMPEVAQRIVLILDDKPESWTTPSDKQLVSIYPVPPQHYVTSDYQAEPWLQKFGQMALATHQLVFEEPEPTRPVMDVARDVAMHSMQNHLLTRA